MASGEAADNDPDSPKSQFRNLLPEEYRYIVLKTDEYEQSEGLNGTIRLPISTKEDALIWVKRFEQKNFCSYRSQKLWTYDSDLKIHRRKFICSHRIPDEPECTSFIIFTIKDVGSDPDYPSQVTILFNHHGHINQEIYQQKVQPSTELRITFASYFVKGHSPFSALVCHKCDIHSKYGPAFYDVVSKGSVCPSYNWCVSEFKRVFSMNFQTLVGEGLRVKLNNCIEKYNKQFLSPCAGIEQDSLVICTPLMKSVFHSGFGEDLITVRTFCSSQLAPKRQKAVLFLCHTPIGSFPFGIIITTSNSQEEVSQGIKCLLRMLDAPEYKPVTIIVDENALISACLKKTFPESQIIFNEFQMLQSIWRIIRLVCQSDNEEFQALYEIFFQTLNSACEEDFQRNLDILMVYAEKHPKLSSFLKYFKHRSNAYVLYAKPKVDFNTDVLNYTDSGTMLLQDVTVKYSPFFDSIQLFQFITNNYMDHYERKLRNIIAGDLKGFFKTNFYVPLTRLSDFTVQKITDTEFLVCLNEFKFFVNAELDTCTCQVGVQGGSCVHQYIVEKTLGLLPECYTPIEDYMANVFQSILAHKESLRAPEKEEAEVPLQELMPYDGDINVEEFEELISDEDELLNDQEHFNRESGELQPTAVTNHSSEVVVEESKVETEAVKSEERVFSPDGMEPLYLSGEDSESLQTSRESKGKDDFDILFVDKIENPELPPLESAEETCESIEESHISEAVNNENNISESYEPPLEENNVCETYESPLEENIISESFNEAPLEENTISESFNEASLEENNISEAPLEENTISESFITEAPLEEIFPPEDVSLELSSYVPEAAGMSFIKNAPMEEILPQTELFENEAAIVEIATEHDLIEEIIEANSMIQDGTVDSQTEDVKLNEVELSYDNCLEDEGPIVYSYITEDGQELLLTEGDEKTGVAEFLTNLPDSNQVIIDQSEEVHDPVLQSESQDEEIFVQDDGAYSEYKVMEDGLLTEISFDDTNLLMVSPTEVLEEVEKKRESKINVLSTVVIKPPKKAETLITVDDAVLDVDSDDDVYEIEISQGDPDDLIKLRSPKKPEKKSFKRLSPIKVSTPFKITQSQDDFENLVKKMSHKQVPKEVTIMPKKSPIKVTKFDINSFRSKLGEVRIRPVIPEEVTILRVPKHSNAVVKSEGLQEFLAKNKKPNDDHLNKVRSNHYRICSLRCEEYHSELEEDFSDDSHFDDYDFEEEDILSDCDSIVEEELYDEKKHVKSGTEEKEEVHLLTKKHTDVESKKLKGVVKLEKKSEEEVVPIKSLLKKNTNHDSKKQKEEEVMKQVIHIPTKSLKKQTNVEVKGASKKPKGVLKSDKKIEEVIKEVIHTPIKKHSKTEGEVVKQVITIPIKSLPKENKNIEMKLESKKQKRTVEDVKKKITQFPAKSLKFDPKKQKSMEDKTVKKELHIPIEILPTKTIKVKTNKRTDEEVVKQVTHIPTKSPAKEKTNIESRDTRTEQRKLNNSTKKNTESRKQNKRTEDLPESNKAKQPKKIKELPNYESCEIDDIVALLSGNPEKPVLKNDELAFMLDDPRFEMVVDQQPVDPAANDSDLLENSIEYVNEEEPSNDDLNDLLNDLADEPTKYVNKNKSEDVRVVATEDKCKQIKRNKYLMVKKDTSQQVYARSMINDKEKAAKTSITPKLQKTRPPKQPRPLPMILPKKTPEPEKLPKLIPAILNGQNCILQKPSPDAPYTIYTIMQHKNPLAPGLTSVLCPIVLDPNNSSVLTYQPFGVNSSPVTEPIPHKRKSTVIRSGITPAVTKNANSSGVRSGILPAVTKYESSPRNENVKIRSTNSPAEIRSEILSTITRSGTVTKNKGNAASVTKNIKSKVSELKAKLNREKKRKQKFGSVANDSCSFEEVNIDLCNDVDETPSRVTRSGMKVVDGGRRSSSTIGESPTVVKKELFTVSNRKRRSEAVPRTPANKKSKKLQSASSISPIDFESSITASVVEKSELTPASAKYEDAFKRFLEDEAYTRPPTIKAFSDTEDFGSISESDVPKKSRSRTRSLSRASPEKSRKKRAVSWSEELDVLEFISAANDSDDSEVISAPRRPIKIKKEVTSKITPDWEVMSVLKRPIKVKKEVTSDSSPKRKPGRPRGSKNKRKAQLELIILLERNVEIERMCARRFKAVKKSRKQVVVKKPKKLATRWSLSSSRRSRGYLELLEIARQKKSF